ncbi:MAG TPA: hypothetical protein VK009_19510 [Chloroflexota bacterium]|nr:hypothetical protein [Chloroflexota bacterium]
MLAVPLAAFAQTTPVVTPPLGLPSGVPPSMSMPTSLDQGHTMSLQVDSDRGAGMVFSLSYPGQNAYVVIRANVSGAGSADGNAVGFDVYDPAIPLTASSIPVEHVTLASNEVNSNPQAMQFAYSGNTAGVLNMRFFNYSGDQLSVDVTPLQTPQALSLTGLIHATFQARTNQAGAKPIG